MVSSGAIAQGKKLITEFEWIKNTTSSTSAKQALAAMGQSRLMNLYEGIFSRANIPIAQILFGTLDIENPKGYDNLENTFNQLYTPNLLSQLIKGVQMTEVKIDINNLKPLPEIKITNPNVDEPISFRGTTSVSLETNEKKFRF